MRHLSGFAVAIIVCVAVYFALSWGIEGWQVLTSPSYGLDDVERSQFVFVLGSLFALSPVGLLKLAAFFGALKLAVAAVCGAHVIDRLRAIVGGTADADVLEGALMIIVVISIVSVGPAIWSHSAWLVRETTIELMLAAAATGLSLIGRGSTDLDRGRPAVITRLAATPRDAPWFSPFR